MANINEILARAAALRDETALNSISPERAGGIMYDTLIALNELWLQQGAALVISKIYASVAAMEADTAPVSDLTGQPLRPGQIVVIASSDSDNGSVYRYNGTSSPSWSLVGEIGNLEPVDSLDSDSTSLPLAAHQGKVLDGKISQLGQIAQVLKSEFDSSIKYILNKYYNWSDGVLKNANGWVAVNPLLLIKDREILLNDDNTLGIYFYAAILFNESMERIGAISLGENNQAKRYKIVCNDIISSYPTAKYIGINISNGTVLTNPITDEDVADLYTTFETTIDSLLDSVKSINVDNNLIGVRKELILNRYYFYSTGELKTANGWIASILMPFSKFVSFSLNNDNVLGLYLWGAFLFDASKSYLGNFVLGENKQDRKYVCYGDELINSYPTAKYVAFNISNGNVASQPLTKSDVETIVLSLTDIDERLSAVEQDGFFLGKKWAAVGDSLTERNLRTSINYVDYIGRRTGIIATIIGKSGAGYKKREGENFAFYQLVESIDTDSDIVTIMGSSNDYSLSDSLGTPTDTTTDTICGCINTTLNTILTNFLSAGKVPRIGVIAPPPTDMGYPNNAIAIAYVNALKQCCELKSIPFLDLFHCSNLHPENSTFRTLAYSHDEGGGTHPDELGHNIIYPVILAFMKSIMVY